MADTISPDELVGALTSAFSKYSSEIRDKIDSRVEEIGNEAVEEVKSLSPVYAGKNKKLKKEKTNSTITRAKHHLVDFMLEISNYCYKCYLYVLLSY